MTYCATGGTRRPRSVRLPDVLERLEVRRHLASATDGVTGSMHLVGCACAACAGGGARSFYEQPLTATEKRVLHGDDQRSAALATRTTPSTPTTSRVRAPSTPPAGASLDSTPGAPVGQRPTGALANRILYTAAGHGFTAANTTTGDWSTQRGLTNGMVEDMGNVDQMTQFVYYAWNAGATIVPTRPVGYQPNEVVMDNTSAGVTFTGTWTNGGANLAGANATFFSLTGANPTARYREAIGNANETAVARYTPNIAQAGFYPVYAWVSNSSAYVNNNLPDQLYRITHSGGKTEVKVDHRRVGKGWVYLGTYHFNAGSAGSVEISNKTASSGRAIADGMRFGNGMGDINRGGGVSGQTREDESSLYWVQKQAESTYESINGAAPTLLPASTYRGTNTLDDDANVGAPPRWAAYMNNSAFGTMTDRLFLSYHSNAGSGANRGSIGLYNGNNTPSTKTPFQQEWALYAAREVNDDLVALSSQLEFAWFNRTGTAQLTLDRTDIEFGEINNSIINNEFDATILEVAFHDNAMDAALMRDPKVRQWIARSSVQAAVRYFNDPTIGGGGALNFAPDAPTNLRAITSHNGDVTIRWTPPVPAAGTGAAATGYVIESSDDGYGFDGGIVVPGGATNVFTIPAAQVGTGATYFRVISTSAGGWSPPSEVVGARALGGGGGAAARVLIVNGFERFEKALDPKQTSPINGPGTSSTFDRVRPRYSNSFDYVIQAGEAIEAFASPIGFDSAQNEAMINGQVNLGDYNTVIWLSGEESTANDTFNPTEQALVTTYINGGGHFFVSGAEIAWDLDAQGGGPAFLNSTLRADYVGDDANTYSAAGAAGSIFAGIALSFDNGQQFYNVDFPDRLAAINGSTSAMTYTGGTGGTAAIQFAGSAGERVVLLGFPFETITTAANRAAVMSAVLTFFNTAIDPSPITAMPLLAPESDTGVSSSDNVTRLNNSSPGTALQFNVGSTVPGALVKIYADGTLIGTATASAATTTVTTNGTTALADGAHAITATQTLPGQAESAPSAPLQVTIDTIAPNISGAAFAYDTSHRLGYIFSEDVGPALATDDLLLANLTTSTTIDPADMSVAYDALSNLATITFPGLPNALLPDGNYRATIPAADVTDIAGNALPADHVLNFFYLTADANHDAAVNLADFNILAANFGQSPRDYTQGDFNYDGTVNLLDFNLLAARFGTALSPAAAAASRATATTRRITDELDL
jgi:hypothetical protein